ncbi:MAG TPA: hypothetical protein VLI94_06410 [Solirubrobacterales bacterium]|nr:hypothetical protein [Solirubrobacterales bacterium]
MAVMMSPRERWTDERIDDLNEKVNQGFADLKTEMKEGFERVDKRFAQVDKRFERIENRLDKLTDRFESLNRTLWGGAFVIAAALIGSSAF